MERDKIISIFFLQSLFFTKIKCLKTNKLKKKKKTVGLGWGEGQRFIKNVHILAMHFDAGNKLPIVDGLCDNGTKFSFWFKLRFTTSSSFNIIFFLLKLQHN